MKLQVLRKPLKTQEKRILQPEELKFALLSEMQEQQKQQQLDLSEPQALFQEPILSRKELQQQQERWEQKRQMKKRLLVYLEVHLV